MNFNNVRKVLKALGGLTFPSGNPYSVSSGIPTKFASYLKDPAEELASYTLKLNNKTDLLIDLYALQGDLFSKVLQNLRDSSNAINNISKVSGNVDIKPEKPGINFSNVNNVLDSINGIIPIKDQSKLTSGINSAYDIAANAAAMIPGVGPAISMGMKIGGLVSDGLTAMGVGTDLLTTADKILDSKFFKLNPLSLVNAGFAKKTREFSANQNTIEKVGSSYGGTVNDIASAEEKANKKYGLFSNRKRKQTNSFIDDTELQLFAMTNIADETLDIQSKLSDLNYIRLNFNLSGGFDLRYIRAARLGTKLLQISLQLHEDSVGLEEIEWQIDFFKEGGVIDEWIPKEELEWIPLEEIEWQIDFFKEGGVIDEWIPKEELEWIPLEEIEWQIDFFKEGGVIDEWIPKEELEWIPLEEIEWQIDFFKEGGKTEEVDTPEIEKNYLENIIPEGALHKNKHHMENDENITKKGIPVIDNDGELQAEVEKEEIIFSLEVTKKLEELYHEFFKEETSQSDKDELAILAGKLLVKEILYNTDDRTGLIDKCQKGGKL